MSVVAPRMLAVLAIACLLTGCKLALVVSTGGDVTSASGTRNCPGGSVCEHDITDLTFKETFTAEPRRGYVFSRWHSGPGFLCGGSVTPTCVADNTVFPSGIAVIEAGLASGHYAYAMPLFEFVGIDTDDDGIKDHLDDDDDNDGVRDIDDPCPTNPDLLCGDVDGLSLSAAGALSGVRIGATLEPAEIDDGDYAGTLLREFGAITPENAMKMYSIQNQRGVWTFAGADAVIDFAEANDLPVRGHTLVWAQDQFTPAWVKAISDPAELREVTEEYIAAVAGRYAGRIPRWDVVNEPLATFGPQSSGSVWENLLGPDWIAEMFELAHAADPEAELWINEYGTDWVPGKHQAFLALVTGLVEDEVPLHGVGLQTHRISVAGPERAVFEQQLRDFTNLGLEVAITELDVVTSPTDPAAFASQAEAYRRIAQSCLAVAGCVEITTWGITDATSWLNSLGSFPTPTRPLLFDDDFVPKPAYFALRAALATGRPPSGN
jgi:endo-1,4-beta-xylanase